MNAAFTNDAPPGASLEGNAEEMGNAPVLASDLAAARHARNQRLAVLVIASIVAVLVIVFGVVIFVHYAATHHTFLDAQ